MIRTEREYRVTLRQIADRRSFVEAQQAGLNERGLSNAHAHTAMEPLLGFQEVLEDEVAQYERIRQGIVEPLLGLSDLGRFLIDLRIASGLSPRQLAERMRVPETQVSRDERHEYFNIGTERTLKILEALSAQLDVEITGHVRLRAGVPGLAAGAASSAAR